MSLSDADVQFKWRVLRIDLSAGRVFKEELDADFARRYLGGQGVAAWYLNREVLPGVDSFDPENRLIFSNGILTGVRFPGAGRGSVAAKSPLSGGFGCSEFGGFFSAELRHAGWDTVIIHGKAATPVYLWICDDKVEVRSASALWGLETAKAHKAISDETGDPKTRVAAIGPAGENRVRYAGVIADLRHAAGRTGIGAVMGSKNLKAVAVRGQGEVAIKDPERVDELRKTLAHELTTSTYGKFFGPSGTAGGLSVQNATSMLPTKNFRYGTFPEAKAISGEKLNADYVASRAACFACPLACKRVVKPEVADPSYGGPEYETMASFGSLIGVSDLGAICKAHERCNALGIDSISTGVSIAFAMECAEKGLLEAPAWGDSEGALRLLEDIAYRRGLGDLLAEGVKRAAEIVGHGSAEWAMHVHGQELPMHEPKGKWGVGLGYVASVTGADHNTAAHDILFAGKGRPVELMSSAGLEGPVPPMDIGPKKASAYRYLSRFSTMINCLVLCNFVTAPMTGLNVTELAKVVAGVTGWDITEEELLAAGDRATLMARCFNVRHGVMGEDRLPKRLYVPFESGLLRGKTASPEDFSRAVELYYELIGCDKRGVPLEKRLLELGLDWLSPEMKSFQNGG